MWALASLPDANTAAHVQPAIWRGLRRDCSTPRPGGVARRRQAGIIQRFANIIAKALSRTEQKFPVSAGEVIGRKGARADLADNHFIRQRVERLGAADALRIEA